MVCVHHRLLAFDRGIDNRQRSPIPGMGSDGSTGEGFLDGETCHIGAEQSRPWQDGGIVHSCIAPDTFTHRHAPGKRSAPVSLYSH